MVPREANKKKTKQCRFECRVVVQSYGQIGPCSNWFWSFSCRPSKYELSTPYTFSPLSASEGIRSCRRPQHFSPPPTSEGFRRRARNYFHSVLSLELRMRSTLRLAPSLPPLRRQYSAFEAFYEDIFLQIFPSGEDKERRLSISFSFVFYSFLKKKTVEQKCKSEILFPWLLQRGSTHNTLCVYSTYYARRYSFLNWFWLEFDLKNWRLCRKDQTAISKTTNIIYDTSFYQPFATEK